MKVKGIVTLMLLMVCMKMGASPIDQLLERIDKGASKKFKIELVKTKNPQVDFFELDQQGQRVVVRANNWVSAAVGVNWYLKHFAGIHLTWNQMKASLPTTLPK